MKTTILAFTAIVLGTILILAAGMNLSRFLVQNTPAYKHAVCLSDAVQVYPAWTKGQPNVTDTVPSCQGLSVADKTALRRQLGEFVTAALRNEATK